MPRLSSGMSGRLRNHRCWRPPARRCPPARPCRTPSLRRGPAPRLVIGEEGGNRAAGARGDAFDQADHRADQLCRARCASRSAALGNPILRLNSASALSQAGSLALGHQLAQRIEADKNQDRRDAGKQLGAVRR